MVLRVLVLTSLLVAATSYAAPENVAVYESRQLSATTEGDTTIDADPDAAYLAATDYSRWPMIFRDLREAKVTQRSGDDAHVSIVHGDGTVDRLHFHNRSAARTLWFEQLGGDADVRAEVSFVAGERSGTTHVHSRLYVDVHGFASALVTNAKLRELRQQQVRDDLGELQTYFSKRR